MRHHALVLLLLITACSTHPPADDPGPPRAASTEDPARVTTDAGTLEVIPFQHASFLLQWEDLAIHIDPVADAYAASPAAAYAPMADIVLVTDLHGDHLDPAQIAKVRKPGATVIAPEASAIDIPEPTILANGASTTVGDVTITAVPMYNIERTRPDSGELFHIPGRGNGYLITRGQTTIYVSGDTECIPEMKALKDIDVAFVCMNLPYTMPLEEAASCVKAFKPAIVFPFHHRGQDPFAFKAALSDLSDTEVRILDWYPATDVVTGQAPD